MVLHMGTTEQHSRAVAGVVAAELATAGITQQAAALRTGIPLSTFNRRINGHSPFLVSELHAVAGLLGTTVADLVGKAERGAVA